ncbi:MAG TPA: FkbM family methyltransferase, partial [Gemmataceae bacterium]|nr:FkbM family methyltransferase [Gemmataceae bacterium]
MFSLKRIKAIQKGYWRTRQLLGLPARHDSETLDRLRRLEDLPEAHRPTSFDFPWGRFEFVHAGQLRSQFEEIFISRQYAFTPEGPDPIIIDCGGNVGLSAIWFKLRYPTCKLTVYEVDPDLGDLLQGNLQRAGFGSVEVCRKAVWIANATVPFERTGDNSGRIVENGSCSFPAIDLSANLPDRVDLLKLDIEGAEYAVLDRLCETGAIERVRRLVCEFHVWRDSTDDLLRTLTHLRAGGMCFSMSAAAVPWIGQASEEAPFEVIKR